MPIQCSVCGHTEMEMTRLGLRCTKCFKEYKHHRWDETEQERGWRLKRWQKYNKKE